MFATKKLNKTTLAAAVFAFSFSASGTAIAKTNVTILGGPVGGGWYLIAGGMSEIIQGSDPDLVVRVAPGGGLVNPARVGARDADFALSLSVNAEMAKKGADPYEEKFEDIRSVAWGFNPTIYQVVARKEVPVSAFEEIFTKKYPAKITSPGLQTMGGWSVKKLLGVYNTTIEDVKGWGGAHYQGSHSRSGDLLRDGQADVLMTLLPIPAPNILEVSNVRELKFLPFSKDLIDHMVTNYGYGRTTIPADAYKGTIKLDKEIPSLVIKSGLIVNKNVPDDTVYRVTKALFQNIDRVQKIHKSMRSFIAENVVTSENRGTIELHPGAKKYYDEAGLSYK